jgi:peroxiredoxin
MIRLAGCVRRVATQSRRTFCVGQDLSKSELLRLRTTEHASKSMRELFGERDKVVVFGIVGAFTSVCQNQSLTSVVKHLDALKAAGATRVLVASVNDPFVLAAFAKPFKAHAPFLEFVADPDAEFATAIDATVDLSAAGLGLRSHRYALVVNGGRIEHQLVEEKPSQHTVTDAARVIPLLSQPLQQTWEAKVAAALAANKPIQVMRAANQMAVYGLTITPPVYAAMVQSAARQGFVEAAEHFVKHWQHDATANFSPADATQCAKWIAAAPKKRVYADDPELFNEIEQHALKIQQSGIH